MKIKAIALLILVLSCSLAYAGQETPWGRQSLAEYTDEFYFLPLEESITKLNSIFNNWDAARETVKESIATGDAPDVTAFYLFGIMKDPMLLEYTEGANADEELRFIHHFYRYRLGREHFDEHLAGEMQALLDEPFDSFKIMFLPFLDQSWAKEFASQFRFKADGFVAELLWWSEEIMKHRSELKIPDEHSVQQVSQ